MSAAPGRIQACALPPHALLQRYANDGYADCYAVEVDGLVSQSQYVTAFYSTRLFGLERWLLAALLKRASTDEELRAMAEGTLDQFAAWSVEAREADQLLLCDMHARTRSWLMSESAGTDSTRLYFGSAVVPHFDKRTGRRRMGFLFHALLGFHKMYSRALLRAACRRLART